MRSEPPSSMRISMPSMHRSSNCLTRPWAANPRRQVLVALRAPPGAGVARAPVDLVLRFVDALVLEPQLALKIGDAAAPCHGVTTFWPAEARGGSQACSAWLRMETSNGERSSGCRQRGRQPSTLSAFHHVVTRRRRRAKGAASVARRDKYLAVGSKTSKSIACQEPCS